MSKERQNRRGTEAAGRMGSPQAPRDPLAPRVLGDPPDFAAPLLIACIVSVLSPSVAYVLRALPVADLYLVERELSDERKREEFRDMLSDWMDHDGVFARPDVDHWLGGVFAEQIESWAAETPPEQTSPGA